MTRPGTMLVTYAPHDGRRRIERRGAAPFRPRACPRLFLTGPAASRWAASEAGGEPLRGSPPAMTVNRCAEPRLRSGFLRRLGDDRPFTHRHRLPVWLQIRLARRRLGAVGLRCNTRHAAAADITAARRRRAATAMIAARRRAAAPVIMAAARRRAAMHAAAATPARLGDALHGEQRQAQTHGHRQEAKSGSFHVFDPFASGEPCFAPAGTTGSGQTGTPR